MKRNRISSLVTLLGLVVLLVPGFASAQELTGKFTLPFEAHWGQAVLTGGEYTFVISSGAPHWIRVQRDGSSTFTAWRLQIEAMRATGPRIQVMVSTT